MNILLIRLNSLLSFRKKRTKPSRKFPGGFSNKPKNKQNKIKLVS